MSKVRETIETAAKHKIEYPFARRHRTYIFDDDVVIRLADDTLISATGKYKHHQLLEPIAERYMEDLGFDSNGLANEYIPESLDGRRIVLQPHRRFGAPVVLPCNYTVESLVCAVASEGSVVSAARVMGVEQADVVLALRYEQRLERAAA